MRNFPSGESSEAAFVPLSFIVIARNQAATIGLCLESVLHAARTALLPAFEIIYVDSASTDGSVEMVRERLPEQVRIIRLTGAMNAGIARNVGAASARGRALFFVDGDMELDPSFLRHALDEHHHLVHPLVTGQLPERIYDSAGKPIGNAPDRYRIGNNHFRAHLGGVFLVDRVLFERNGGFSAELRCNEDLDLGLRLAHAGTPVLALAQPIAKHHTIDYFEWNRLMKMVADGSLFYPAVIFRRHIGHPQHWHLLVSLQRSTGVLVASAALGALVHPAFLALYVSYVGIKNRRTRTVSFVQDFAGTTARSICFLLGLVAFYPRRVPAESITCLPLNATS